MLISNLVRHTLALSLAACSWLAYAEVTVYLGPDGRNTASGKSEADALPTLKSAIDAAIAAPAQPGELRRIVVLPGTYMGQGATIRELPADAPLTIAPKSGAKPVFDGGGGKARVWLTVHNAAGRPSRLTVRGLEITNYVTAISLNGERTPEAWNGSNIIQDNVFRNIGQVANPEGPPSQAVIRLVNSRDNRIIGNSFVHVRNFTGCSGLHAIYIAHYSSGNLIENNTFEDGCGAVIKTRDQSNNNIIRRNRFVNQDDSPYLDLFCDKDSRDDCNRAECPSWDNVLVGNTAERLGARARKAPIQVKGPDKPTGCPMPSSKAKRTDASNNRF